MDENHEIYERCFDILKESRLATSHFNESSERLMAALFSRSMFSMFLDSISRYEKLQYEYTSFINELSSIFRSNENPSCFCCEKLGNLLKYDEKVVIDTNDKMLLLSQEAKHLSVPDLKKCDVIPVLSPSSTFDSTNIFDEDEVCSIKFADKDTTGTPLFDSEMTNKIYKGTNTNTEKLSTSPVLSKKSHDKVKKELFSDFKKPTDMVGGTSDDQFNLIDLDDSIVSLRMSSSDSFRSPSLLNHNYSDISNVNDILTTNTYIDKQDDLKSSKRKLDSTYLQFNTAEKTSKIKKTKSSVLSPENKLIDEKKFSIASKDLNVIPGKKNLNTPVSLTKKLKQTTLTTNFFKSIPQPSDEYEKVKTNAANIGLLTTDKSDSSDKGKNTILKIKNSPSKKELTSPKKRNMKCKPVVMSTAKEKQIKQIHDDSFDALLPANEPNYAYKGDVIRKKSEKSKVPGWDCKECSDYHKALNLSEEERKKRLDKCSRHRSKYAPVSNTPEGFWNVGWDETFENTALDDNLNDKNAS